MLILLVADDISVSVTPVPGVLVFEYVVTLERYNAEQGVVEQFAERDGLSLSDFPLKLTGLPAGSYNARVDAITAAGTQTIGIVVYNLGEPGMPTAHTIYSAKLSVALLPQRGQRFFF